MEILQTVQALELTNINDNFTFSFCMGEKNPLAEGTQIVSPAYSVL